MLKKYNLKLLDIASSRTEELNISMPFPDFYHELSYKIGEDFNITLIMNDSNYTVFLNQNSLHEKSEIVDVDEMYTLWSGLCYKITRKVDIFEDMNNTMILEFAKSMPEKDIPTTLGTIHKSRHTKNLC